MVNRIIDGISIRINEVFGDDYEIYSEDIEQGFKEPCFFILPLNQKKSPKLKNGKVLITVNTLPFFAY